MGEYSSQNPFDIDPSVASRLSAAKEAVWFRIGVLQSTMNDRERALEAFERVLAVNPENVKAMTQAGAVLAKKECYPQAVSYLQRAISADQRCGEAWAVLAHCYVMTDDLQKAYQAYQSALSHLPNPRDPNLWYGIGLLYDRYGSLDHALEAFLAVLSIAPDFERADEVCFCIGIIYKEQQNFDEALKYFNKVVVAANPPPPLTRADGWYQIGHVNELKRDIPAALDMYKHALVENPKHPKTLQNFGWLEHQHNNNSTKAIQLLKKSADLDPSDGQTYYLLGRVYMALREFRQAYDAYQQAVYRDGKNATFWCSIGVLYYQMNQYRDAMDAYSRAIKLNPMVSEVWYDLGTLYESCGQNTDAIDAYRRAAELAPENPQISQRLAVLESNVNPNNHQPQQGGQPQHNGPQPVGQSQPQHMQSDIHMSAQSQLPSHMNPILNSQMGPIGSTMQQPQLQQPKPNANQSSMAPSHLQPPPHQLPSHSTSMNPSHLQQNASMGINPRSGQMDMTIPALRPSVLTNGQPVGSTGYNHDTRPLPPPLPSTQLSSPRQSLGMNNLSPMVSQPIQSLPHSSVLNMAPQPQDSMHQMQNRHGSLPQPQLQPLSHAASQSPQNRHLSIPHMDSQQQGQHQSTLSAMESQRQAIHQSQQDQGRQGHDQNQTNPNQVDQQGSPGQARDSTSGLHQHQQPTTQSGDQHHSQMQQHNPLSQVQALPQLSALPQIQSTQSTQLHNPPLSSSQVPQQTGISHSGMPPSSGPQSMSIHRSQSKEGIMTDKPSHDTMNKVSQSETPGNSHQMKPKIEEYGTSDQARHNDDNQRDNAMDISNTPKPQNIDRPITSSASPTGREMPPNSQVLYGPSQESGAQQDSRRDDASSAREPVSDPNTNMRRRSMSMDEITQPQNTENKQMEIRDGGDQGKPEMNRDSSHAPNDQTNGDKPKQPERLPAVSSFSTHMKDSDSREDAKLLHSVAAGSLPMLSSSTLPSISGTETGKPISGSMHANQDLTGASGGLSTGQPTLPPIGSRNGSSLNPLGQDSRDNPNSSSIGLGASSLTQFGKGIMRTPATPVSTTVIPSSLPSPLPPRKKTVGPPHGIRSPRLPKPSTPSNFKSIPVPVSSGYSNQPESVPSPSSLPVLPALSSQSIRNDDENGKNKTGDAENDVDKNKDVRDMKNQSMDKGVEEMGDRDNMARGNHQRKMDDNMSAKPMFGVLRSAPVHHNDGNSGQGNRDERMKSPKEGHDDESYAASKRDASNSNDSARTAKRPRLQDINEKESNNKYGYSHEEHQGKNNNKDNVNKDSENPNKTSGPIPSFKAMKDEMRNSGSLHGSDNEKPLRRDSGGRRDSDGSKGMPMASQVIDLPRLSTPVKLSGPPSLGGNTPLPSFRSERMNLTASRSGTGIGGKSGSSDPNRSTMQFGLRSAPVSSLAPSKSLGMSVSRGNGDRGDYGHSPTTDDGKSKRVSDDNMDTSSIGRKSSRDDVGIDRIGNGDSQKTNNQTNIDSRNRGESAASEEKHPPRTSMHSSTA